MIDFGVAKATHQKLTEKTLYTQLGQIVGTLEYMSPEQAVLNQLDVDTRTDVYSLGVVLYELLVGETPLNGKELRSQGLEQILRTIREQEPPRPSLRLSSQGGAAAQTAAYRKTDQSSLSRTLRGDLDWIVMKALEKDRSRRYESASRLAEDLNNYLQGDTVEARPPTIAYRTAKLWKRNRVLVSAASAVVLALSLGFLGMWNRQAELERLLGERDAAIVSWHQSLIERGIEAALQGDLKAAKQISLEARQAKAPEEWTLLILGLAYQFTGDSPQARKLLADAHRLSPDNLGISCALKMAAIGDTGAYTATSAASQEGGFDESLFDLPPSKEFGRYELLFRGWSQVYEDPTEAIKTIDQVIESDRPWPFAQAMMAMCLFHEAYDTGEARYALQALEKIRPFESQTPDSPFILFVRLHCRIAACLFASEEVDLAKLLSEMEELAKAMERFPNGWAADSRFAYYELVDSPRVAEEFKKARNDWWQALRAAVLLRFDESWSLENQRNASSDSPFQAIGDACALAITGESQLAMEIYNSLDGLDALTLVASLEIPLLVGDLGFVESESAYALSTLASGVDTSFNNAIARLRFLSGGSESDLLAEVDGSLTGEVQAHYLIGLRLRALSDNRCFDHFRKCVETKQIWMRQYHFSKTLLMREELEVPNLINRPVGNARQ